MCAALLDMVGGKQAAEILWDSLSRLEYRGYDSAGIAVLNGGVATVKCKGRLKDLKARLRELPLATQGIVTRGGRPTAFPAMLTRTPITTAPGISSWSTTGSSKTIGNCGRAWLAGGTTSRLRRIQSWSPSRRELPRRPASSNDGHGPAFGGIYGACRPA